MGRAKDWWINKSSNINCCRNGKIYSFNLLYGEIDIHQMLLNPLTDNKAGKLSCPYDRNAFEAWWPDSY